MSPTRAPARKSPKAARPSREASVRWDDLVVEASHPPFELVLDDDNVIVIEAPTGDQIFAIEDAQRDGATGREFLRLVCGDAGDDVLALAGPAPAGAIDLLGLRILKHFGIATGEARASSR